MDAQPQKGNKVSTACLGGVGWRAEQLWSFKGQTLSLTVRKALLFFVTLVSEAGSIAAAAAACLRVFIQNCSDFSFSSGSL